MIDLNQLENDRSIDRSMRNSAYEKAEGEGGDDVEGDGDGGELEVSDVPDEDLRRGVEPEKAHDVERDRSSDGPELLGFCHEQVPCSSRTLHRRVVFRLQQDFLLLVGPRVTSRR